MDYSKCMYMIPIFMKNLYEENGELPIRDAIRFVRSNSPPNILNTDEDIKEWLNFHSAYFRLKNNNAIVGTTRVTLCDKHCKEPGSCRGRCSKLHLCRFFILTEEFRCPRECRFNHDFKDHHNDNVLRKHHLQFLNEDQLRCLFRKPENRHQQTLPPICWNFNSNKCEKKNCSFLHICKRFIIDRCPYKKNCNLSHLIDGKILAILRNYGIYITDIPEGLQKLRHMYSASELSSPTSLRKVGLASDIRRTSIDAQSKTETGDRKILFPSKSLTNLSTIGRGRQRKQPYQKRDDKRKRDDQMKHVATTTNICMNFLAFKYCSNSDCKHHHRSSPYQWQYKIDFEMNDWKDFDPRTNEELEKKYCSLFSEQLVSGISGFIEYNFENMTVKKLNLRGSLRRLSTASSAEPNQVLNWATVWLWYFEMDSNNWIEYSLNKSKSPVLTSLGIEEMYLRNPEGKLHFVHKETAGFIDFKKMYQMHEGKRAVRRRPKPFQNITWINRKALPDEVNFDIFSSSQCARLKHSLSSNFLDLSDLDSTQDTYQQEDTSKQSLLDLERRSNLTPEAIRKQKRRSKSNNRQKNVNKVKQNEKSDGTKDFEIINLDKNDPEFLKVSKKFNATMEAKGAIILGIEAIQNAELWEKYGRRKTNMIKRLGAPHCVNEMDLFHGTDLNNIPVISKRGFDARLSEEAVSTRYGKGSYFMEKADYAHKYIGCKDNTYKMLLAKVLTGRSCKGKMTYISPPLIDPDKPNGDLYDSCYDDDKTQNVFVIFSNDQMFPAYIITYEADF